MAPPPPFRVALIGAGDVAERDYLPEWHRLEGQAEISVVCARTPERARRVAEKYGIPRWSVDYRESVASDVDAVVNLTPIGVLPEITRAALEAGRHVYTEKPLATDPSLALTLVHTAARKNLTLVSAPSIMLFPQIALVRRILDSGAIGAVRAARAQVVAGVPPWPGYHSDPSPYFAADAGPLLDLGVYPLHVLTGLLGPVSQVSAMSSRSAESFTVEEGPFAGKSVAIEADDEWQLVARIAACTASVEVSYATVAGSAPACELRGERGAVAFSLLDVAGPVSLITGSGGERVELPVAHGRSRGPDHILGVEHLLECMRTGARPVPSGGHAVHVLQVIEAAREAASSGRSVAVAAPPAAGAGDPFDGV